MDTGDMMETVSGTQTEACKTYSLQSDPRRLWSFLERIGAVTGDPSP